MKYFLIFLLKDKVVNIYSFDEETARDNAEGYYVYRVTQGYATCDGIEFDSIQTLDQI